MTDVGTQREETGDGGTRTGVLLRVRGVVQGVGFRPFVHGLAVRHALDGWVRNGTDGVEIAVEGVASEVEAFVRELRTDAPPLARIDDLVSEPRQSADLHSFSILASAAPNDERQPVAPDVTLCNACERELYDPADRRYRYPFITCTDCGPRYSLIERMPYDRDRTSMREFVQCPACRREYETPANRRFHSESNSCTACGPRLWLEPARDAERRANALDPLEQAARLLREGLIVAVRGIGGFHLAVDATNEAAVARLRAAKHRDAKPFAVMVRTLNDARAIADLGHDDAALLTARERPIVLTTRRAEGALAPSIAPGLNTVGLMLAYSPLHHLLLDLVGVPLVMTSGNASDEPIVAGIDEARERLSDIADAFLFHDREIVARIDDSVVRVAAGRRLVLRRARGIAPLPLAVPVESPIPLLAVGGHLKNTFTLVHGRTAYVGPHVGDLGTLEALGHFRATVARMCALFRIEPEAVAHDSHPAYLSTAEALRIPVEHRVAVQHHHAHIAAVMAEHNETGRVIGVAYDGTGYGDDGTVWGAELMVADLCDYERVAHLRSAPLPGNEVAVRSPWRSAMGYLSLDPGREAAFSLAFHGITGGERRIARQQAVQRINAPLASSMGRLFDAAAAVLGIAHRSRYEGEAAMRLEALAGRHVGVLLPFPVHQEESGRALVLDPLPLLAALGERAQRGDDPASLAAAFHDSVAAGTTALVRTISGWTGLRTVCLGGGSFQNARLLATLRSQLEALGMRVLWPRLLPPNDGGLSYGQAAVAAARLARFAPASLHSTHH
jgi:hydrogenase maturation protein HypF